MDGQNRLDQKGIGGIDCTFCKNLDIFDCLFQDNEVFSSGVVMMTSTDIGRIENSQFLNNWAINSAGAVDVLTSGEISIKKMIFRENSAGSGGGIHLKGVQLLNIDDC